MSTLRLVPTRADVLAETAVAAAGGGHLRLLRPAPLEPGIWLAEVVTRASQVIDLRLEPELGTVTAHERAPLRRVA